MIMTVTVKSRYSDSGYDGTVRVMDTVTVTVR